MTRHATKSRLAIVASRTALAAALLAPTSLFVPAARAQDLDLSGIASEDVKKEATGSGSLLPSFGTPSSKAPAVASGPSWTVASVLDPFGLFTSQPEPEAKKPVRRQGTGVVAVYQGGSQRNDPIVVTKGGAWWDPLELFVPVEEEYYYEDVNDFLNQDRAGP